MQAEDVPIGGHGAWPGKLSLVNCARDILGSEPHPWLFQITPLLLQSCPTAGVGGEWAVAPPFTTSCGELSHI